MFGALRDQLADFTSCLQKGKLSAVADLKDAVEALRIAEAIITAGRLWEDVPENPVALSFGTEGLI